MLPIDVTNKNTTKNKTNQSYSEWRTNKINKIKKTPKIFQWLTCSLKTKKLSSETDLKKKRFNIMEKSDIFKQIKWNAKTILA